MHLSNRQWCVCLDEYKLIYFFTASQNIKHKLKKSIKPMNHNIKNVNSDKNNSLCVCMVMYRCVL